MKDILPEACYFYIDMFTILSGKYKEHGHDEEEGDNEDEEIR